LDACCLLRFTLYFFHDELGGNGFGILTGLATVWFLTEDGGGGFSIDLGIVAFSFLGC
jgi:hypothetical protein